MNKESLSNDKVREKRQSEKEITVLIRRFITIATVLVLAFASVAVTNANAQGVTPTDWGEAGVAPQSVELASAAFGGLSPEVEALLTELNLKEGDPTVIGWSFPSANGDKCVAGAGVRIVLPLVPKGTSVDYDPGVSKLTGSGVTVEMTPNWVRTLMTSDGSFDGCKPTIWWTKGRDKNGQYISPTNMATSTTVPSGLPTAVSTQPAPTSNSMMNPGSLSNLTEEQKWSIMFALAQFIGLDLSGLVLPDGTQTVPPTAAPSATAGTSTIGCPVFDGVQTVPLVGEPGCKLGPGASHKDVVPDGWWAHYWTGKETLDAPAGTEITTGEATFYEGVMPTATSTPLPTSSPTPTATNTPNP